MKYILVENRTTVLLGPMFWNQRMFQSELDDIEIPYKVPSIEQDYIEICKDPLIEMFPIVEVIAPDFNSLTEHLSGPWYTYENNQAIETWGKDSKDLESIRGFLRPLLAEARYNKEVGGTPISIQDQIFTIDTARGTRDSLAQQYLLLPDEGTINWKFPEGWVSMSKAEFSTCVDACAKHVQNCFDWERITLTGIESGDATALQAVYEMLKPPTTARVNPLKR